MISPDRLLHHVCCDTNERRQFGVSAALAFVLLGIAFYFYVSLKFVPDMGIRLLQAAGAMGVLLLLGPRFTLPMYFATMFGTAIGVPGLPVSLNKVCAAAFFLSWGVTLLRRRFTIPLTPALGFLTVFTIYAVAMGVALRVPGTAPSYQQVVYLLLAVAVASHFRVRAEFESLLKSLLVLTCLISVVGPIEYILRRDLFSQFSDNTLYAHNLRINGISKNAIQFAFNLTWMLPWALLLAIETPSKWVRRFSFGAILYIAVLCFLTRNRQSPIIIAAMLVWGVALIRYRYRGRLLVLMTVAGIVFAPLVAYKIAERFTADRGRDMSLTIRRDKFLAARQMITENPWFGIGFNNFKDKWWDYKVRGETYVIHTEKGNQHYIDLGYLQLLVEMGIVGVVLYVCVFVATLVFWWRAFRAARRLGDSFYVNALAAASMGFVQIALSMMLQDTFFIPRTYLLYGFLLALVTMMRAAAENETIDVESQA
ncbi:MAG: O-antigen ligase [Candidatus Sumerlaeota bacterium]|nr:O-antigen ligase [Candidatus Sumerlaeota bacterium]